MIYDHAVKKLLAQYEKAFSTLDVEKQVPLFAQHFISAVQGQYRTGRDEFARMASKTAQFYQKCWPDIGQILSMDETCHQW